MKTLESIFLAKFQEKKITNLHNCSGGGEYSYNYARTELGNGKVNTDQTAYDYCIYK